MGVHLVKRKQARKEMKRRKNSRQFSSFKDGVTTSTYFFTTINTGICQPGKATDFFTFIFVLFIFAKGKSISDFLMKIKSNLFTELNLITLSCLQEECIFCNVFFLEIY